MTDLNELLEIINKELEYFNSKIDNEYNLEPHIEGRKLECLYLKKKIENIQNRWMENAVNN